MKRRFMPTVAAFIMLIFLLTYANYYETHDIPPPGMQQPTEIMHCGENDITALTWLNSAGEIDLKMEIKDGQGAIVAPASFDADQLEVKGLLAHFGELKAQMVVEENATNTAAFGISPDSPAVRVETATSSWLLTLGEKSPIGGSYFLVCDDDPRVFLVPAYINGAFNKTMSDVRSRAWFNQDFGAISRITIEQADHKVVLQRDEDFNWFIEEPVQMAAQTSDLVSLIHKMREMKISRFINDSPEPHDDYGFAEPRLNIVLTNEDDQQFSLMAGERAGTETYVKVMGEPAVHATLNSDIRELSKGLNDLRAKHFDPALFDEVSALKFFDANESVEIVRNGNYWLYGEQIVDAALIEQFIDQLNETEIFSFHSTEEKSDHGLDSESPREFTLTVNGEARRYIIGEVEGASLSLLHNNEIFVVNSEIIKVMESLTGRIRDMVKERSHTVGGDNDADAINYQKVIPLGD